MTVTKESLSNSIKDIVESRTKASKVIDTILDRITKSLENGKDVLLSGFGKFCIKDQGKRRGRNPATGNDLMLDARRVVTFKPSGAMNRKLNNGND